jgi:hypothetical protein
MSVRAFAARKGLDRQRFYVWQRKLAAPTRERAVGPAFVELRPSAPELVEVVLRSGVVLRVRETIDGELLRQIVEALERPPC